MNFNSKPLLYTGIALFILGIATNLVLYKHYFESINSLQLPLLEKLSSFPPILTILFPLFFAPIIEEFAFRYWTKKTFISVFISFVGISLYVYFFSNNYFAVLSVSSLLVVSFYRLLKNRNNTLLTVILTSFLFSLIHISNYDNNLIRYASVVQSFGLSLVLVYIGLNRNFIYCILIHFLNNLIALLPLLIVSNSLSLTLENSSYRAELKPVSILTFNKSQSNVSPYSIVKTGNIANIAAELNVYCNDTIYKGIVEDLLQYTLNVKSIGNEPINQKELFNDLILATKLDFDTLEVPTYEMRITDFNLLKIEKQNGVKTTLYSLVASIRNIYRIPLTLEESYVDQIIFVDLNVFKQKSTNNLIRYLKDNFNIELRLNDERKSTLIEIKKKMEEPD